jgi:hypothetical protein
MERIRKTILLAGLITSLFIIMFSCDKISEPFTENNNSNPDTTIKMRKVLLEEFTGHLCVYCPQGHRIAHEQDSIYVNRLIIVSIHAGFQSIPLGPPWNYDFRTTTGNDLNSTFGITNYPSGLVNRKKFDGSIIRDKDSWGSDISTIINTPAEAFITITNAYNSTTRKLDVTVNTEILSNLDGVYRLCVYLTEDSIIKPQKNNSPSIGPAEILDYEHTHVLRGAINSTWGDTLAVDAVAGQVITKTFSGYSLNASWKEDDCKVIAFIYRDDDADGTRYEVVQAEKKKLK